MKGNVIVVLLNILFFNLLSGQSVQNIRGTVRDKLSNKSLEYATATVVGTHLGTMTDSLGQFVIRNVPVGRYDIQVNLTGYEPVLVKELLLTAGKEVYLELVLTENVNTLNEIVITPKINKSQPLNAMALGSARMFGMEEAGRYAGGFDDPARLATAFAGVTGSVGNNGIVVRGNSPKFLQWRLEDVELPNPNHFANVATFGGGGFTAFSSQLIGNSDFFTGAFPAEYGNALSGVFDMKLRNGNNQKRENTFQFGVVGIDFASEGPFRKESNASYIFNYRYSTLALLSSVLPENAGAIRYQDISFKLNFPTAHVGVFSFWGIGLIDRSGQKAKTDTLQWNYASDRDELDVRQYMGAFGLNHRINIANSVYLKTSLAATVDNLDFDTDRLDDNLLFAPQNRIRNTNLNLIFSSSVNLKFNANHTNKTGVRITGLRYDLMLRDASYRPSITTVADESGFSALLAAYSSSSFNLSDVLTFNIGLNVQLFTLNGRRAVEPRAGLRWKFKSNQSVGVSYGLHSRLEMLYLYFTKSTTGEQFNQNLDFTRAHHIVATYDRNFVGDCHLRIEPYVQRLFSVPVVVGSSFSMINVQREWFISDRLANVGKGFNYGIDATFEKYMSRGYYGMFTASLFDSRYNAGDDVWRNTRYNRRYVFNLLGGKEWMMGRNRQNIFNANIRLSYQGGDRYSPVDHAASQQAGEVVYLETNAFARQYAPTLLCHVTVAYKINRKNTAHELALKVINATMNREYLGHKYNLKSHTVDTDYEVTMAPNISYKIEF
jgi:hypothetical protein